MITAIIPTLCELARRDRLLRSIDCLLAQEGVAVNLIIVVNGQVYDPGLLEYLRNRPELSVHFLREANDLIRRLFGNLFRGRSAASESQMLWHLVLGAPYWLRACIGANTTRCAPKA